MINECSQFSNAGSLLVFSDDWGRHPSSCQHLVRNLLDRYPVLWVNTIGTRAPRLDLQTLKRASEKIFQWGKNKPGLSEEPGVFRAEQHPNLTVVNPKMWPWFGSRRDRRLNSWLLSKQLTSLLENMPQPIVSITTLPITADLPDVLPVDRWVYYCVDDFSLWPGLDGDTLRRMDCEMIRRADSIVAVSENLQAMIAMEGRSSSLLTHGVDVDFWKANNTTCSEAPASEHNALEALASRFDNGSNGGWSLRAVRSRAGALERGEKPRIVFWGVIDRRMDSPSLQQLSRDLPDGTILLVGPQQDPDPAILSLPNVQTLAAQPLSALPAIAAAADVLIMPYADLLVTRAMQPLKLKEYLATGKPVVVNRLPSTEAWSDCLDIAESPEQFSRMVRDRVTTGTPESQITARSRLRDENWHSKAEEFDGILNGQFAHQCMEITQ